MKNRVVRSRAGPTHPEARGPTPEPDAGATRTEDGAVVSGAGEMARRIRLHDWASTPLGSAGLWPRSLRAMVNLMLSSGIPMYIGWGQDLILLHNDAYSRILGASRLGALGQPISQVWPEIWTTLGQGIAEAIAGRAIFAKDLPRLVRRNGYAERTFFTFSTSPLYDDDDHVGGIFCVCLETTDDVVAMSKSRQDIEGRRATLTASIGISLCPAYGDTLDGLLGQADAAIYAAKHLGRNGVQSYAASVNGSARERFVIESDLRRALQANEFQLHYQPQIHMASGRIRGIEALIRWNHPRSGTILPERFIPVAEESGLILPIGIWVLAAARRANRIWQERGLAAMPVSVNISPVQLRQADVVDTVSQILADTALAPACLELEVPENLMINVTEVMVDRLRTLRTLGVRLSIDRFGTGYSTLQCLKSLPLDRLKIDRSFVGGLPADPHAAAVVRAIVGMAHSLGLVVLADGVGTSGQADFLAGLGCDQSQGPLYGSPRDAAGVEAWCRTRALRPAEQATTAS